MADNNTTATTTTAAIDNAAQTVTGTDGADERKTGEIDVQAEAQKIADAMLAKKLKGMPSKEDVADWKANRDAYLKWRDEQKTEAERMADKQREIDDAMRDAKSKQTKAEAIIAAAKAGLHADHIEDAVILALAKMGEDTSIEDAMAAVVAGNPGWMTGVTLPQNGGNPAKDAGEATATIKRHF